MKHLKHFSSLNEELFQGIEVLPKEALSELEMYYINAHGTSTMSTTKIQKIK